MTAGHLARVGGPLGANASLLIAVNGEALTNNVSSGAPSITGTVALGNALTADTSGISDTDGKPSTPQGFQYQWFRGSAAITGATAPNYYPSDADVGQTLKVEVSFRDDLNFQEGPHASAATIAVPASTTIKVPWSGTMTVGTSPGSDPAYGYGTLVTPYGSLSPTSMTIGDADFTVRGLGYDSNDTVTFFAPNARIPEAFTLLHGGSGTLSSTASTAASGINFYSYRWSEIPAWRTGVANGHRIAVALQYTQSEATGNPTITGTTTVGQTLTADKGDIADANGLSDPLDNLEYQWIRVDESATPTTETDISGATSSTYELQAADFGKKIKVRLTFNDRAGFSESSTSDATATIGVLALHSNNGMPRGVWGNADTIWVSNDSTGAGNKIFAYNRDGTRDSSKDFDTLQGAGNTDIQGIWSDGTTMFVVDSNDDKLYAYTVSTKANDSAKEFTLDSFNDEPRGIWGNADTIWVSQDGTGTDNKIFAYKRSNGNRDSDKNFETLDAAGNTDVEGIWSDGTTMFVVDSGDDKVFAYKMADKSHDSARDFALHSDNGDPMGIWSDGDTVYVVDATDDKLYLYQLAKPNATGAPAVSGTPQLGEALRADTTGIADEDGLPDNAQGYRYQWVRVDESTTPTTETDIAGATAPHYYPTADDVGKSLKVKVEFEDGNGVSEGPLTSAASAAIAGSDSVKVLWSTTMTVGQQGTGAIGYRSTPSFGSIADDEFTYGDTDYTITGAAYFTLGLGLGVSPELGTVELASWRFGVAGTDLDLDEGTHGTQSGASVVQWTDHNQSWNVGDRIALAMLVVNSPATGAPAISGTPQVGEALTADTSRISDGNGLPDDAQGFTYQWQRGSGSGGDGSLSGQESLHSDNGGAIGVWGNTDTVWVSDFQDGKLYAYNRSDWSRKPAQDFDTLAAAGNVDPRGIWSDGATMWVADASAEKLFAYNMSDKSHDSAKDITLDNANDVPRGVWGNADTIWVAQDDPNDSSDKIFAYKRSDGAHDTAKDFTTLDGAGNNAPTGIWSDGTTMWVADTGDDKVYAYRMSDRSRNPDSDFDMDSDNGSPQAIWSDGSVMHVADSTADKVFAYSLPGYTDIAGATAPDYYPTDADAGKHIRVQVSFQDGDDFDEGPINSVGRVTRGNVLAATLTAAVGGPSVGYQTVGSQGALTPNTFSYQEVDHTVTGLVTNGGNLIIRFNANPDTSAEDELTLVIGSSRFRLSDATHSTQNQTYTWTNTGITWNAGQTVSIAIEGDIYDPTADVIVQPSTTVSVPWSATVTVGEETGGTLDGFLGTALNFFATPFGALSDSAIDIVGQDSHSVAGVTYDSSGSGTLTLYVDLAFAGLVRLAYGADATLATTAATEGTEGAIDKYDWSPHDDPGWADGDRVAFAIVVNQNVDATGAPTITGTVADGETLSVDTSAIDDPNGLTSPTFTYQWERESCADSAADGDISGETTATYTVVAADLDCVLAVTVTFKDDDGYPESRKGTSVDLSLATWEFSLSSNRIVEDDANGVTATLRITNSHTFDSAIVANLYEGAEIVGGSLASLKGQNDVHTITIPAGQSSGAVVLVYPSTDVSPAYSPAFDIDITARFGGTMLGSAVTLTRVDNQNRPALTLSASATQVTEGESFTLRVDAVPPYIGGGTIKVAFQDPDGGITNTTPIDVIFAAVQKFRTVTINTVDDTEYTPDRRLTFSIETPPDPFTLGTTTSVTVIIVDDEVPNSLPTGSPTISGTVALNEVLTVDTSTIADANGLGPFSYQWSRTGCTDPNDDENIAGETNTTYTVVAADLDCVLKVTVTYTDGDDYDETLSATISRRGGIDGIAVTSDPGADDTYAEDDWIEVSVTYNEAMTVSGTPQLELDIGGTPRLADYHAASSTSTVLVFRYQVGTTDLDGDGMAVSASKLTLNGGGLNTVATPVKAGSLLNPALAADADHKVDGVAPTLVSATVAADGESVALVFSEDIDGAVSGSDIAGRFTLRRSDNSAVTFGDAAVSGTDATDVSLSDPSVRIQEGWTLTLEYDDPSGDNADVVQDLAGNDLGDIASASVTNQSTYVPNSLPTGSPTIDGMVALGEVLTVDTSTIADANGLGPFSYQWSRTGCTDPNDDGNIAGETNTTYTVEAADLDCVLKVTVTYTDDDQYEESLFALTIDLSLANWSLSRNRSSVTEGGTVTVTLRITNGHTYSSAVVASVYDGDTPVADGGLLAAQDGTHTITVPAGQNQGSVTLTARDDDLYNYPAGFANVQLTARVGQTTLGSAVSLTVRDNESRPSITLSASSDRVIEGESITLTATAQPRYAGAMTVTLSHTDNSRILSGAVPTILEFAAESATAEAVIATENDDTEKLNAQVTFTLSEAQSPGRLGSPGSVTLDWVDDDGPPLIGTPRDGLQRIWYLDEAVYGYRPAHGLRFYWWSVTGAVEYKLEYRKTGDTGAWSRATVGDFDQSPSITHNRILTGVPVGLECGTPYDVRLSLRGARPDYVDGFGPYVTSNGQWTGPCPKPEEITNVVRTAEPDCFTITWTRPTNTAWTGYRVARHVLPPDNGEGVREVLHERVNDSSTRFRDCSNQHGNKYGLEDHSYIYDVQYLRRGTGLTLLEEGPRIFTPDIDPGAAGRPPSPRNLRLTTDTRTRRTMTWEAPPNHYLTANRALRGDLRRGSVTDPWINGYIVERREFTGNPTDPYSIEYPAGSSWETMREGYDDNTTTSYTDNSDRGTKLYVYRVRTTNRNGASSEYTNDYLWDGPVVFSGEPGETEQAGTPAGDGESGENHPATGAPAISGTARVGETLTASTSGIADQDGLDDVSYSYQWIRSDGGTDSDISGANSSTYELTGADQGKTIKVKVTFRDDADNDETLTSAATATVAAASSEPLTASIQGQPASHDGQESFTFELRFSEEVELSYLTLRDHALTVTGGDVTGAQRLTQGSNLGWRITVEPDSDADVTVLLPVTSDCSAQGAVCTAGGKKLSAGLELTVPGPPQQQTQNSEATGAPTVSGTLRVGETLTAATSGISDADGIDNASFSYQWIRDDADIAGETARTYDLTGDDVGRTIKVRVSFRDDANNEETVTSAATGVVAPRPPLTASIQGQPSSHDGQADFTFQLRFSEEVPVSYLTLRDHAFTVTGGTVIKAQRLTQGSNIGWRITVTPSSDADVIVALPVTTDCDAQGAICTGDGRKLSNRNEFTVSRPTQ